MSLRSLAAALAATCLLVACAGDAPTAPSPTAVSRLTAVNAACDGATIPATECQALVELYAAAGGDGWTDDANWLTDPNPCTWAGVVCSDGDHGVVRELVLVDNNLVGTIPAGLDALQHVERILLGLNHLAGSIPASLGDLPQLEGLSLASNQLTGGIPVALANLSSLERLDLGNNPLGGTIPAELGGLANLTRLVLSGAQLTGPIPASLGDLTQLTWLSLHANHLTGSIPASLGQLVQLETLELSGNDLTGAVPASFGQLTALRELRLSFNELSGALPAALGNLTSLELLNSLDGPIPASFANLTALRTLSLTGNEITGSIPAWLGGLPLEQLSLDDNALTGGIPDAIAGIATLEQIRLGGNGLSGTVSLAFAALEGTLDGYCFLAPGNVGLEIPDAPAYHALDANGDGRICGLYIGTAQDVGEDAIDGIEELVPDVLGHGQANALVVKLEQAIAKANDGKYHVALNLINAFVTQLEEMVADGSLTPAQAAPLLAQAQFLVAEWTALL